MIFNPQNLFLLLYLIWFIILSFLFFKFYSYYSKFTKGGKKESIAQTLDAILQKGIENKKDIDNIYKKCDKLEKEGLLYIQKVGLVRFNPFKDTGGDQSFILALLDAQDTGVVISSLHTRTGTRWYAKRVIHGKGTDYELSEEEGKALKASSNLLK